MNSFSAIIFDMDGVIIHSEPLWEKADYEFFKDIIPHLDKRVIEEYRGQSHSGVHKFFVQKFGLKMSLKEFVKHRNRYSLEKIYSSAPLQPGFLECLKKLYGKTKIAIGTSSFQKAVDVVLQKNNLKKYFDAVITSEDVNGIGKPAPNIYLLAAKKLEVDPKKCLVIEDSKNGIVAGKNAGMTVFAYRNEVNKNDDLSPTDKEFESFEELFTLL